MAGSTDNGRGAPLKVSAYFPRQARTLFRRIRRARQAVLDEAHGEAIHDLRVAIRRLRSVLRSVRGVYGPFHVQAISGQIKRLADRTNALRDAEILEHSLPSLHLGARTAEAIDGWLAHHRESARAVRESIKTELAGRALETVFRQFNALFLLPVRPGRDRDVASLAAARLERDRRRLLKTIGDPMTLLHDTERLHRARILAKRLRYTGEFYRRFIPRLRRKLTRAGRTLQTLLGQLHDLDVLMRHFADDGNLEMQARAELLLRLSEQRAATVERAREPLTRALRLLRAQPRAATPAPAAPQ
jgi:CHAD domain-containing protein